MFSESEKSEYVKSFSKIGEFIGLVMVSWFCGGRPSMTVPSGRSEAAGAIDELLTPKEAAKRLRVSQNTFASYEKRKLIARVAGLGVRTVRYRPYDVDKLKNRKRE